MNVQVYVDGELVLNGDGTVESQEDEAVELIVTDSNGHQHIVQYDKSS